MQTPRLSSVPPAAGSEAADAAFLAAGYGLVPDEWQELVLRGWLGVRPDGKWSSPRCGLSVPRQNGKNGTLEVRELFGAVELGERILHTAHEVKTARKAFARLLEFFDNEREYPELSKLVKEIRRTNGQEAIVLANGGSVEFVARSKNSGRGYSVDVLVLDEAQELGEDALAALVPTVSASPNPQVILTGTPPGPRATGEVFTRTRTAAVKGGDPRLCWMEWSCEGEPDLDDPAQWAMANPAVGIRLGFETIADERGQFDDATFRRERLGMWDDVGAVSVFGAGKWDAGATTEPSTVPVGSLAFAVSIDGKTAAISGAAQDGDAVHGDLLGHGTVEEIVAALPRLQKQHDAKIVVDRRGPAAHLIPQLKEDGVHLVEADTSEVLDACAGIYELVQNGKLTHRTRPQLDTAAAGAVKRDVGDRWAWGRKKSVSDISPLEALTLAVWGLGQQATPAVWDWPDDL